MIARALGRLTGNPPVLGTVMLLAGYFSGYCAASHDRLRLKW